jgi:DNA-binding beta-propeller fold protein YncE
MNPLSIKLIIAGMLMLTAVACSRGEAPLLPPVDSEIHALQASSGMLRISAGPGSADAGTSASITEGGSGSGTVASDGSFSFDATAGAIGQGAQLTTSYIHDGFMFSTKSSIILPDSLISLNAFSTGSAPNDLLFANDSLYVANSLDNSVVRHDLAGSILASASFPQYSSPSYLVAGAEALFAVLNGSNVIARLTALDLAHNEESDSFPLIDSSAVFIGPAAPAFHNGHLYVPRSEVLAFAEFGSGNRSTYGPGLFTDVNFAAAAPTGESWASVGSNPQYAVFNEPLDLLLIVSGGELNFSADFTPYVSSPSYLELYSVDGDITLLGQVSLGLSGAGAIAISPDGRTAYLGNSLNGNLYKVDIDNRTVLRGLDNPIILTEAFTYISDVELTSDGRQVLATSFNTDELFIFPSATDTPGTGAYPEPLDMSQGQDLLAGAAGVELDGQGHVYVLNAIANSVNRITLLP